MVLWLAPKRAAEYFKENNADTMIKEHTIRHLIKEGFPSLQINSRTLINVETFNIDLEFFAKQKKEKSEELINGIRKITV